MCTWHIEGVQQTVPHGSHTSARLQESLLGGYIALQIAFMYAHHLMWNYLPALQRSYAPLSSGILSLSLCECHKACHTASLEAAKLLSCLPGGLSIA